MRTIKVIRQGTPSLDTRDLVLQRSTVLEL